MATSFVEFKQIGFWVDDRLLRLWLYFLTAEVGKLSTVPRWLREASGNWRQESRVGSTGCVQAGLDEYITTPTRSEILVAISAATCRSVQEHGAYLLRKNLINCELFGWAEKIATDDVCDLAVQFIKLVKGELTSLASSQEAQPEVWAPQIDLFAIASELGQRDYPQVVVRAFERSLGEDNVAIIPGDSPLPQPHDVFSFAEYKFYIREATSAARQTAQAYLGSHPEWSAADSEYYSKKEAISRSWLLHYLPHLPIYLLARCPFCGGKVSESVDTFSLNGFGWNNDQMEPSGRGWWGGTVPGAGTFRRVNSFHSECQHTRLVLYGVNLNGCEKFDELDWSSIFIGAERPYLIPSVLQVEDTCAVLHSLPLGRVTDREYVPRYTIYFTTYFTQRAQEFDQALEPYRSKDGPPRIAPYDVADYDLSPWVQEGRLFWLDSTHPDLPLAGGALTQQPFPYANVVGREGRWILSRTDRGQYVLRQLAPFFTGWFGY